MDPTNERHSGSFTSSCVKPSGIIEGSPED